MRWFARSTVWLLVLASAATAFPIVVARLLGRRLPALLDGPIEWCWIWLAGVALITVVTFATLGSALSPTVRGSWVRAFVPFAPVALGMTICFVGEAAWLEPLSLAHAVRDDWTKGLLLVPPFVVAGVAFGRSDVSNPDGILQLRYAAIAMWLAGSLWTGLNPRFVFACFSPMDTAEYAGCSVYGTSFRMACGVTAVSWIAMSLVLQRLATRDRFGRIDAVGLGVWIATSVAVDGLAWAAGRAVCGASDGREEVPLVDELATVADTVQWFGAAVAALCWGRSGLAALGGSRPDSWRESWRALWPVLPILWIASSPAFDAPLRMHSVQQFPDAAWEQHASFEPLTRPGVAGQYVDYVGASQWTVIGTLSADGELWLYHGRHAYVSRGDADVVVAPDLKPGRRVVELMVDRRVTLGQLTRAAQRLRRFDGISIVWRTNELHRASRGARNRWAFVEMGSRAVAGYELALHRDTTGCIAVQEQEPRDDLRPVLCDQGFVLGGSAEMTITSVLQAIDRTGAAEVGRWGIEVPAEVADFEIERPITGMRRGADPIYLRVFPSTPLDAFLLAIGLLALVFAAVVGREYLCARRLTRVGARVDDLGATTSASSAWNRWRASLGPDPVTHPYRRPGTDRTFTPLDLLRRDLAECAKGAARACALGAVTWLVVAWLGCMIGALALWLGR